MYKNCRKTNLEQIIHQIALLQNFDIICFGIVPVQNRLVSEFMPRCAKNKVLNHFFVKMISVFKSVVNQKP